MIEYNNIEEVPKSDLKKPRIFNGEKLLVFESISEHDAYLGSRKVWSKEAYSNAIKEAIDLLVSNKLIELDYTDFQGNASIGDVNNGVNNTSLTWHTEAVMVKAWYDTVYEYRDAHLSTVTEATAISAETFISTLPSLGN